MNRESQLSLHFRGARSCLLKEKRGKRSSMEENVDRGGKKNKINGGLIAPFKK